ncbi:MAG: hypothetical protein HYZ01_03015 [Ignavibacteriales bacterium]|nr:hypothetical protein [Ignavibacteriales bacterium]
MKQQRWFLSLTTTLLLTTLQGCLDIATDTVIHKDGSIERSVMIEGDSVKIYERRFPIALGGSWQESIEKIDSRKYRYTASQNFPDVAALNKALTGNSDTTLGISASLEKRFEWFFTVYRYSERHASFNKFNTLPLTDYLTQAQIDLLFNKKSGEQETDTLAQDEAERNIEEWLTKNIFEAFFAEFLAGVKSLNTPSLSPDVVMEKKEELFHSSGEKLSNSDLEPIQRIFEETLGRDVTRAAIALNDEGFRKFKRRLAFQQQMFENSYRATAEMPGLIVGTNAATVEGNSVTWEDFILHGVISDYDLWVESREVNWWMIYLTGVVIILGFLALIIPLFWKRGVAIPRKIR